MIKTMFRFVDGLAEKHVLLTCREFHVIKETESFCWVRKYGSMPAADEKQLKQLMDVGVVRKVKKGALRSFCHVTREEAFDAYRKRKQSQQRILDTMMTTNAHAIAFLSRDDAKDVAISGGGAPIAMGEHGKNYIIE